MKEEWRTIPNFPNYAVSSLGRVMRVVTSKHHPNKRILKGTPDSYGYLMVTLYNPKPHSAQKIHTLVTNAFIGPCPDGLQRNHKDGNKTNNAVTNLEYITLLENIEHATVNGLRTCITGASNPKAKLTDTDVREIRNLAKTMPTIHIARKFDVTTATIRSIKFGRTWKHLNK